MLKQRLLDATLEIGGESVRDVIAAAQVAEMSVREILGSLVADVAHDLGRLWIEDEVTFLDVTIGSSKLHRAIHDLRSATRRSQAGFPSERILLTTVPGEQHALGAAVAEQLLWQEGYRTELDVRGVRDVVDDAARGFDAVAIAVPSQQSLARLGEMVERLRRGAGERSPCRILLGGPLADAALADDVGADGAVDGVAGMLSALS